jgi:hypothetical protein
LMTHFIAVEHGLVEMFLASEEATFGSVIA